MSHHRFAIRRLAPAALLAAVALLTLGACAPATHPSAGHTGHAHSGGSGHSSSSPTPVAVAPPVSRVGVTCSQVAPLAQVNSTIGATLVATGGLYDVSDLTPYAFTQEGAIECDYGPSNPTSEVGFYEVEIIPDVSSTRWATFAGVNGADLAGYDIKPSPFGANTYLDCTATYHDLDCDLDALIGTTLLYIDDYSAEQPTESNAAAETHMMPLLTTAVNALKAATISEPAWTDPNATSVNISESEATVGTTISTAIGSTVSPAVDGADELPDPTQPESLVQYPLDFRSYVYDSPQFEMQVDVLPQGSWAFSQIAARTSSLSGYALIPGLGDQALGYSAALTNKPHAGVVEATKGDNLISVEIDTTDASEIPNLQTLAKKAATALLAQIS